MAQRLRTRSGGGDARSAPSDAGVGDDRRDVEGNTATFTAAIERHVRSFPDQWLWIHKRWKTRPAGEADIYARRPDSAQKNEAAAKISSPPETEKVLKT